MTPAMRKAWNWLRNDMGYKPPEQLGTAEEIALNAFSFGWAKGSADGAAEEREECAKYLELRSQAAAAFAEKFKCEGNRSAASLTEKVLAETAKSIRARGKT